MKTLVIPFFLIPYYYLLIWSLLRHSVEGVEVEDHLSRRRVDLSVRSQG